MTKKCWAQYKKMVDDKTTPIKTIREFVNYNKKDMLPDKLYRYRGNCLYYKEEMRGEVFHNDIYSFDDLFDSTITCSKIKDLNRRKFAQEEFRGLIWGNYHIACFSETFDNILMWSQYANNHRGICIEYDLSKCVEYWQTVLFPVVYSNKRYDCGTSPLTSEICIKALLHKAPVWKYEKEYRAIVRADKNQKEIPCFKNTDVFDLRKSITKIYIGVRVDQLCKMGLAKMAESLNIQVEYMDTDPIHYKLIPAESVNIDLTT